MHTKLKGKEMFVLTDDFCQNCKMLKHMLGDRIFDVEFRKATHYMDKCIELGVKSVPTLVIENEDGTAELITDLGDIVSKIEQTYQEELAKKIKKKRK